ncbi:unnamed protein product, partial [Symbiodinium sp. CCMP2456]
MCRLKPVTKAPAEVVEKRKRVAEAPIPRKRRRRQHSHIQQPKTQIGRRTTKVKIYLGLNGDFVEVDPTETVHTIVGEYAEDHWRRLREDLELVVTDKKSGE